MNRATINRQIYANNAEIQDINEKIAHLNDQNNKLEQLRESISTGIKRVENMHQFYSDNARNIPDSNGLRAIGDLKDKMLSLVNSKEFDGSYGKLFEFKDKVLSEINYNEDSISVLEGRKESLMQENYMLRHMPAEDENE